MICFSTVLMLAILSVLPCSIQQQLPFSSKKAVAAIEDVPFIRCDVCRAAVKHITLQVEDLRSTKGKKVDEDDILMIVEASCDAEKRHGDWISKYDIVEADSSLKIVEHESPRRCQQECKTISKACEDSIGDIDTDLGELLWKDSLSLSRLIKKVCYEMTDACTRKIPMFKRNKRHDEVFKAMNDEERKAINMMKKMKSERGMSGMEFYSKDDIAQELNAHKLQGQGNEKVDKEEDVSSELPVVEETNLGFLDTIKATVRNLYSSARKLFSSGSKRTEF